MTLSLKHPTRLSKYLVRQTATIELESHQNTDLEIELIDQETTQSSDVTFTKADHIYTCHLSLPTSGFFSYTVRYRSASDQIWQWLSNQDGTKQVINLQVDPDWLANAVFYCVFVRFFKGRVKASVERQPNVERLEGIETQELLSKTIDPKLSILPGDGGTFDDVKAHLDTLQSMNINALYFNPIHLIGQIYRGYNMLDQLPSYLQPGSPYSIKDYKSIDPELTYDSDTKKHLLADPAQEFKDLIDAAHKRGMSIIMDLVFNHTAHDFVFQRLRPEWYLYKQNITSLDEPYLYPSDVQKGLPWGDPKHSVPPYDHGVWWEDCAQLNWEYMITPGPNDPPKNQSMNEMWEYFKSVPKFWIKHFKVDGFRCDVAYRVPAAFWKECIQESRELARQEKSNLANDVVYIAESYTSHLEELQNAGFSAVYGDFSHKVNTPLNLKGYLDYIYNLSGDHFPDGSRWFHFPDSHDFDRSPRKILGENASDKEGALKANQSRWLLTACLPGIPLIFNGFEKIEWQPINIWSYGAIDWEKDGDLRDYIARVNAIRHSLVALQRGSYTWLETNQGLNESTQLFAFERKHKTASVIVIVNMDVYQQAGPAIVTLPDSVVGKSNKLYDHLTRKVHTFEGNQLTVILEPAQSHIFTLK